MFPLNKRGVTTVTARLEALPGTTAATRMLWLEITGKCPLQCVHCYAESGPKGTHGSMEEMDWIRVIDEGAAAGVKVIQFIGGEPTTHPALITLINHALGHGIQVEVYSNLLAISNKMWAAFQQPGVRLATSYYSGKEEEHEEITKLARSYRKTKANIAKAIQLLGNTRVRVGIVHMLQEQDIDGAYRDMLNAGVQIDKIRRDHLREVGRGIRKETATVNQLCGQCGKGKLAIMPNGDVHACVFSRWMDPVGNVLAQSLQEVLLGTPLQGVRTELTEAFTQWRRHSRELQNSDPDCVPYAPCDPDYQPACSPDYDCDPICDPNTCQPAFEPAGELVGRRTRRKHTITACNPEDCTPLSCTPDSCDPVSQCDPTSDEGCSPATVCQPAFDPAGSLGGQQRNHVEKQHETDSCDPTDICPPDFEEGTDPVCDPISTCDPVPTSSGHLGDTVSTQGRVRRTRPSSCEPFCGPNVPCDPELDTSCEPDLPEEPCQPDYDPAAERFGLDQLSHK